MRIEFQNSVKDLEGGLNISRKLSSSFPSVNDFKINSFYYNIRDVVGEEEIGLSDIVDSNVTSIFIQLFESNSDFTNLNDKQFSFENLDGPILKTSFLNITNCSDIDNTIKFVMPTTPEDQNRKLKLIIIIGKS